MWGKHTHHHTLDGILRGLNYAANAASDMAQAQFEQTIGQYFDLIDGVYKPKIVQLQLDETTVLPVSLFTLSNGKSLFLEELDIDFAVKLSGIETKKDNESEEEHKRAPQFTVEMSPSGKCNDVNTIQFKAKFRSLGLSEAIMRVHDRYANTITPIAKD